VYGLIVHYNGNKCAVIRIWLNVYHHEELDVHEVSALCHAVAKVKQHWSVIGWVTENLLSIAPPCFRRHVKLLVAAAFAVVSIQQPALGPRGRLWPVLLVGNP
jgi:hypothetical protein